MIGCWGTSSLPSRSGDRSAGAASLTDLLVLADATPEIGAGHAMRCAALADAWRDLRLGSVGFSGRVEIPFVMARLRGAGADIVPAGAPAGRPRVILLDSYDPARREQALATPGTLHVLVDDLGEPVPVGFDVVWNPNAYADANLYPTFAGSVVAGTEAVPLRDDLPTWRAPNERRLGVALGGGAPPVALQAAVEKLLDRLPGWVGSGVGTWLPGAWRRLPAENPWSELVRCDRLLVASGTTVWESAAVGIPVALVQTAPNQTRIFDWARRGGVPGVNMADAGRTDDLAGLLGDAVMAAAILPPARNGAPAVARSFARLASERMALP